MVELFYDLHIHSCLSPCGEEDMTPANIVGMAVLKGLDVIAITDHNSCKNCPAAMVRAKEAGITLIPGMELTTMEEVHVLCLFAELNHAMDFDSYVSKHLIPFPNDEKIFGKQQICDERDRVVGTLPNLLINATDITFDSLYDLVVKYHGITIPAHIDGGSNSLLSNLGFVPPDSRFRCVEIKDLRNYENIRKKNPFLESCNIISNSDGHYLEYIKEPIHILYGESNSAKDILAALYRKRV